MALADPNQSLEKFLSNMYKQYSSEMKDKNESIDLLSAELLILREKLKSRDAECTSYKEKLNQLHETYANIILRLLATSY